MDVWKMVVEPLACSVVIFFLGMLIITLWDCLMNAVNEFKIHSRQRKVATQISKDAVKRFKEEYKKIKSDPDFK